MINDAAVDEIFDKVVSYAMGTGRFDLVNQHEAKDAPHRVICSIWIQNIRSIRGSGLNATSGIIQLNARIYMNFKTRPYDMIDPEVTKAVLVLMGALSDDFDFGGDAGVRAVDLLGMYGADLGALAGYLEIDRQMFRIMTLTIPVIVNDMFTQEA